IHAGDNGGWPYHEGPGFLGWAGCSEPNGAVYSAPIDAYGHSQGSAIMAAGIFRASSGLYAWPSEWDGNAFYADFPNGWMRMLHQGPNGWERATVDGQPDSTHWATGLIQPVDFQWGPEGQLWWLSMG